MQIGHTNRFRLVRPDFLLHWLFAYYFDVTIYTLVEWLLYHLLYHFCIDLHQVPWGFIEIWFFLDIEKALHYKELLCFMDFYWENETRLICYDTKFHFYLISFNFSLFFKGFRALAFWLYSIFTPFSH